MSNILKCAITQLPMVTRRLGANPQVPAGHRRGSDFLVKGEADKTSSRE